jgi:hypothetical protein
LDIPAKILVPLHLLPLSIPLQDLPLILLLVLLALQFSPLNPLLGQATFITLSTPMLFINLV